MLSFKDFNFELKLLSDKLIVTDFFIISPLFLESKKYKAAIIRIDSPGGDALASDL